ncbi:MAG: glycosyltransferase family 1 protein [Phycisphaera sp.]|nr:MAG: glycosyltransferase family 1 protein [Phycisphaera sp.]
MPTRILHISTRLILGGSQENTILSCEGQARLGHDVHLAYGPIFGPEGSMLERARAFRTDDGRQITLHELPNMVRELNPLKDHFCFHRDLKNLMRDVQPDVVHTHSSKAGVLGRWAAWKHAHEGARPAVVHTIHGPPFMPVEGGALGRAKIGLTNKIYEIAEKFAAKRCHTIVSVADAMTEQFLMRGIGTPGLYTTVRSGMEIEPYLSAEEGESRSEIRGELGLSESDFVIGTVARLAQHKGHDDILDALSDKLRDHPDWKLLWVGDGWWRDRLLAKASELGVRAQLVATGLVEPGRVPGMIRAMDVLAHPSYREGLPRTVPQALLTGVCPVAYDSDGTREACRHEETGLLVERGDIKGLRDCVARVYDDPELRTRLAEHGRDWCKAEFAAKTMVARLEDVYRGAMVLAGRAGCAG